MADEPADTLPPSSSARRGPSRITCEFCECNLTPTGELVGRLSPRARELRDQGETIEARDKQIAKLQARVSELEAAIAAAPTPTPIPEPAAAGSRRSSWDDDL